MSPEVQRENVCLQLSCEEETHTIDSVQDEHGVG